MRRSHCQPYSCRGVLRHATLPYRLVPPIKADLWSGRDKFRTPRIIITVYFILVNYYVISRLSLWRSGQWLRVVFATRRTL